MPSSSAVFPDRLELRSPPWKRLLRFPLSQGAISREITNERVENPDTGGDRLGAGETSEKAWSNAKRNRQGVAPECILPPTRSRNDAVRRHGGLSRTGEDLEGATTRLGVGVAWSRTCAKKRLKTLKSKPVSGAGRPNGKATANLLPLGDTNRSPPLQEE